MSDQPRKHLSFGPDDLSLAAPWVLYFENSAPIAILPAGRRSGQVATIVGMPLLLARAIITAANSGGVHAARAALGVWAVLRDSAATAAPVEPSCPTFNVPTDVELDCAIEKSVGHADDVAEALRTGRAKVEPSRPASPAALETVVKRYGDVTGT